MNRDLISIIVPVYNTSKFIRKCIDSILGQTYDNMEIILVDDGSKDDSGSICDMLSSEYENVRVVHKENEGLGYARNTGLDHAKGKYVTFIDSDDYVDADHIQRLYEDIIENMTDVCYGGHTKIHPKGEIVYPNVLAGSLFRDKELIEYVVPRMCGQTGSQNDCIQMSVCMALYSRQVIEKNSIRFVSERKYVSEDLIFNLEVLNVIKSVFFSKDVGYKYRYNEDSLSHRYLADRYEKGKIMMYEVSERTKKLGIYNLCEQRIITSFLVNTRVSLQGEQDYSNVVGKKQAYKKIKNILKDPDLHSVFRVYKSEEVRFQARVINCLIQHKMCFLLWHVLAIRNRYSI